MSAAVVLVEIIPGRIVGQKKIEMAVAIEVGPDRGESKRIGSIRNSTALPFACGHRLSSRIRIFAFFLGWFHTHVVVNLQQLLLYLLIFLVFLQFMLGIAGASHLATYRAQPELGNGTGGVQLQSMLQERGSW